MILALEQRTLGLRGVPPSTLLLAAVLSVGGLASTHLLGLPIWFVGLAVVAPWVPVVALDARWIAARYQWLALFYLLVVTQSAHVVEHLVQMVQIHIMGLTGANARGVFGAIDTETVHFMWNTWVLAAIVCLLWRYRSNTWLRVALVLALWHQAEHTYIYWTYLTTGVSGTPGLLAQGGLLGGGLPIPRPELHALYNLIEIVPLLLAFLIEVQRVPKVRTQARAA
jgi:hypothetical protein